EPFEVRLEWIEVVTSRGVNGIRIGNSRICAPIWRKCPPILWHVARGVGCGSHVAPEAGEVRTGAWKPSGKRNDGNGVCHWSLVIGHWSSVIGRPQRSRWRIRDRRIKDE